MEFNLMITFTDYYNNKVELSFNQYPFSKYPKHVWVICRYNNRWLLTEHKRRGLEFPGGKVEKGESAEAAAIREVREETGGTVGQLQYVGQYRVEGKAGTIVKNIYFATIDKLIPQTTYFETNGPVLLDKLPEKIKQKQSYSFIMKDHVLPSSMERIDSLRMDKIKS
jgi:8-oxo-dGTP diphosphatase